MNTIGILIPTLKKGGAEKQACLLAKALKQDYDVKLIVINPNAGFENENINLSGLDKESIITLNSNKITLLFNLIRVFKDNHITDLFCYLTKPDFFGPIAAKIAGVKNVYQGLRNASLPKAKLYLEKLGNTIATGAITNNYAGKEVFGKLGIKRQIVIPNCYLNPQDFTPRPERPEVTVITVGRFVAQKDYPTAIATMAAAMKKNDSLRFKIIGHGELEEEVRSLVKHHGIEEKTTILINPPGIMNHLKDADIYLSTSLFEGTSNSIMEGMDAGMPIVATRVGDNDHLVEDGRNGFLTEIKDVDKLTESILKLASDNALRNRMGRESNTLLKERYSFETFQKRYMDLLDNGIKY